jgi:alpha-glucosidase
MLPVWLQTVHHNGSAKYVSNLYPRLGEQVHIRLRAEANAPLRCVYLRTFPDGEQAFTPMNSGPLEPPVRWWEADLVINQPVVHYRFTLEADDDVWWYTAAGPAFYDPLDHTDFRILADYESPKWLEDAVFYQIYPDRFANGDPGNDVQPGDYEYYGAHPHTYSWGVPRPDDAPHTTSFYGGDLQGIRQHLDYIVALGVNAIYLNPIFTAYSCHRYDPINYKQVDPHLGGDEALSALRRALDDHGIRYIVDMVPNHCGYKHAWFLAAQQDLNAPEAAFFTFTRHPDQYLTWMDYPILAKLNYESAELRRRMYEGPDAIFRHWLRPPFSADGYRVDVGNMLGRQGAIQMNAEVIRGIRRAVKETKPDAYVIGENFFDASGQLQGDQWDGVMNYMGMAAPLWHWLRGYEQGAIGMQHPITSRVPWSTAALAATWRDRRAAIPWAIALQQFNLLGSHDTPRIRSVAGGNDALHRLAVIVQMTFPGVPSIYYGDEIGMVDLPRFGPIGCMIWDQAQWDHELLAFHRDLIALRRRSPALQRGGFQMLAVETDTFAYQREDTTGRVIVVAHRGETPRAASELPVVCGGVPDGTRFVEHFSGQEVVIEGGGLSLPEHPQGATLWEETQ